MLRTRRGEKNMTIIPTSKKYWFGRKILKKICYRDCIRLDGEIIMCKECGEKTVECNYKNGDLELFIKIYEIKKNKVLNIIEEKL